MLVEAVEFMLTPGPRWARDAGLLYQMVAFRARFRRNRMAWQDHIDRCHEFIMKAATSGPSNNRAIVFGSGLLIEVPIDYLARTFKEVVLVDAVHGLPERWRLRHYSNIKRIEADITGLIEKTTTEPLNARFGGQQFDLAISANILSQLPLFANKSTIKSMEYQSDSELARAIISSHIAGIRSIASTTCLITDIERISVDGLNQIDRSDLLHGVTLPPPTEIWRWDLAPRPELSNDYDVYSRVGAWLNIGDA